MALTTVSSIVHGEQVRLNITLNWLTSLSGYTITAKIVEGANDGTGVVPSGEDATSKVITTLPIINVTGNRFDVVLPNDLISTWDAAPTKDKPVYGFLGIEVADTGVGNEQQIFTPLQGIVEIKYNPVRSTV